MIAAQRWLMVSTSLAARAGLRRSQAARRSRREVLPLRLRCLGHRIQRFCILHSHPFGYDAEFTRILDVKITSSLGSLDQSQLLKAFSRH